MRIQIYLTLVVPTLLAALPIQGQPQGELIGDNPPAATNASAAPQPARTNEVSRAAAATNAPNAAQARVLGFDVLAGYPLNVTDELDYNTNRPAWADAQVNSMIPSGIKAADGKKVAVDGFMMPVTYDAKGKVTSFLLTKNQPSCCYGGASQIHEFIAVQVSGPGIEWFEDPVQVKGILHVGPKREAGVLSSIYRLEAGAVGPSKSQ